MGSRQRASTRHKEDPSDAGPVRAAHLPEPATRRAPRPAPVFTGDWQAHADELCRLLDELAGRLGGRRRLRDCKGTDGWPSRGVYFLLRGPCRWQQPGRAGRHPWIDCHEQIHIVGPAQAAPRVPGWRSSRQRQPPRVLVPVGRPGTRSASDTLPRAAAGAAWRPRPSARWRHPLPADTGQAAAACRAAGGIWCAGSSACRYAASPRTALSRSHWYHELTSCGSTAQSSAAWIVT